MSDIVMNDVFAGLIDLIATAVAAKLKQQDEPRLLTVAEAAQYLSLSQRTVRSKIADGSLPATREGRCVRLDREVLDRWVALRRTHEI